ncbi:MAG: acyltransferase family protein, partial [Lachnospiraceae bacterium]|nr:acyltransferase family protein [Lachnospiraceae bacterium]
MEKGNNNRYSYIRSLACIGIVFLHMIYGAVTIYGGDAAELPRNISWIVVNNLYWAVPCFVMVTGALLLDP